MKLREDGNYWISELDGLFLMHRVPRTDVNGEAHICVGEAIRHSNGLYEIVVAYNSEVLHFVDQLLIGFTSSHKEAVKVLWEQRNYMNWGYWQ